MSAASNVLSVRFSARLTDSEPMELLSDKRLSRREHAAPSSPSHTSHRTYYRPQWGFCKLVDGPRWCEQQDGSVSTSHPWPGLTSQRAVNAHYRHSTRIAEAVDTGDNNWPAQTLFCLRLPLAWTCQRTAKLDAVRDGNLGQLSYNSPHLPIIKHHFPQFSRFLIPTARNHRCWS